MCIGGNRTKQPALQERTTPDVKPAPTDETVRIQPVGEFKPVVEQQGKSVRNYDDLDKASPTTDTTTSMSDVGINY